MATKTQVPLKFIDKSEDPIVQDLFEQLYRNKSEEIKAEFDNEGGPGIQCSIPFWSLGMVNKQTDAPADKLISLPAGNSAQSNDSIPRH
jgi:hypothetical protein